MNFGKEVKEVEVRYVGKLVENVERSFINNIVRQEETEGSILRVTLGPINYGYNNIIGR